MAKDTRRKLLASALSLFSERWYETVSIAEICRNAKLSNGVFYRYFKDKESLFLEILFEFLEKFEADLAVVGQRDSVRENLVEFVTITVGVARRYGREVSVFREGQYRFLDLERQLRDMYMSALRRVFGRTLDEAEYLYVMGGVRFLATRNIYDAVEVDEALLANLILDGVFGDGTVPESADPGASEAPLDFGDASPSRIRLAEAGMTLFGERGYYDVGVSEICLAAGLSVGTFYQHFATKDEFLDYLVRVIGHSVRYYLSCADLSGNRLRREVVGMGHFVRYFAARPEFYSIVRQAEFVTETWVRDYYDRFESGYLRNLGFGSGTQARTVANFLMGLSHYLGIEVIFSDRTGDLNGLLATLGGFLRNGIDPDGGERT